MTRKRIARRDGRTLTSRRDAMRFAQQYTALYRRVRLQIYPSNERIEWKDGKRVTK